MKRQILLAATVLATACSRDTPNRAATDSSAPDSTSHSDIISAQEAMTSVVMALAGVVGTAVSECDGHPCIKVYVATSDAELAAQIPSQFGGFPVVTEVTGEMRVRGDSVGGPTDPV